LLSIGAEFLSSNLLSKHLKIKIYRTVILPVILYGCETLSLILREERRPRVFENMALRGIYGLKRDEVTGEWIKLRNEELNHMYCSPNIGRMIKSIRMRWAGHAARMEERRGVYRVLVGKPMGKRPLGRSRCRWITLRWISRKWVVGVRTGSSWLRIEAGGGHL